MKMSDMVPQISFSTQIKEAYEVIKDVNQDEWTTKYNWDKILHDVLYSKTTDGNNDDIDDNSEYDYEELKKALESTILERSWYVFSKIKKLFEKALKDSKYLLFYLN